MSEQRLSDFDKYTQVEPLGEGGFGEVYRAFDTTLTRWVALKVPHRDLGRDPAFLPQFRAEAQTAAQLDHPNIVRIYRIGEFEGWPFLEMELVEGQTLAGLIKSQGRLTPEKALAIVEPVCGALAAAHAKGIIHRDIKPANILIRESDGQVLVTDFGLARARDSSFKASLSSSNVVVGTFRYMPPEQANRKLGEIGPASDVYSLGVTLYEMLTGRVPFDGDSVGELVYQHTSEAPEPPSNINIEISREVERVVLKALAKRPEDRFATAQEMAEALRAAVRQGQESSGPGGQTTQTRSAELQKPSPQPGAEPPTHRPDLIDLPPRGRSVTPYALGALILIAVVAAGGLLLGWVGHGGSPTVAPSATSSPAQVANAALAPPPGVAPLMPTPAAQVPTPTATIDVAASQTSDAAAMAEAVAAPLTAQLTSTDTPPPPAPTIEVPSTQTADAEAMAAALAATHTAAPTSTTAPTAAPLSAPAAPSTAATGEAPPGVPQTFTTWFQYDQTNTDPKADEAIGNAYLAATTPQFNQQFAGKWNWVNQPQAFDKMQALLITAVQSGGEVPDLFDADNIPMNALIKNGTVQDLTAWAQQQSWYSQLDPSALSTCTGPDGKLYCIPFATQPYVVFVWKDLWPLGYPKTPELFMTEAARLKAQGHYAMTFFGSTDFEGEAINRLMSMAVLSYGGTFDDGKGNMLLNTPEDVAAIQMLRTAVANSYVPEIAFAGQFAEENAIKDASAASFPTGLFGYRYLNPLTAPDGTQYNTGTEQDMLNAINAGEIYLAPFFAPDGKKASCNLGADSFVIPTGAKNVAAAHDFINWMMDPAQNPTYVTGPGGGFPALKSSLSAPIFQTQFYKEAGAVLAQSPCRPWYGSLQDIPRAQKEVVDTFYNLIKANPSADIATALQNTQDQYNAGN